MFPYPLCISEEGDEVCKTKVKAKLEGGEVARKDGWRNVWMAHPPENCAETYGHRVARVVSPNYEVESGNRAQAALLDSACSHHCDIPAPLPQPVHSYYNVSWDWRRKQWTKTNNQSTMSPNPKNNRAAS